MRFEFTLHIRTREALASCLPHRPKPLIRSVFLPSPPFQSFFFFSPWLTPQVAPAAQLPSCPSLGGFQPCIDGAGQ